MSMPWYRFQSRARLDRARVDLLAWYLAHDAQDLDRAFDQSAFVAVLPSDSPLISALEGGSYETIGVALIHLRGSVQASEQVWEPAESFEQALAAALAANAAFCGSSAAPEVPDTQEVIVDAPPRRRLRTLLGIFLALVMLWIAGQGLRTGLQRHAIAQDMAHPRADFAQALSALSMSLPAHVSACRASGQQICPANETSVPFAGEVRQDLAGVRAHAGRMLAVLAPLSDQPAPTWSTAPPGENCFLEPPGVLDDDRALVAGLCRFRERVGEYELCLSGHPTLSERQCSDLMRLAIVDTVFDCVDCGDRPANLFNQRLEWQAEMRAAAQMGILSGSLASSKTLLRALGVQLEQDAHAIGAAIQGLTSGQGR